jgi:hypothetical protein
VHSGTNPAARADAIRRVMRFLSRSQGPDNSKLGNYEEK